MTHVLSQRFTTNDVHRSVGWKCTCVRVRVRVSVSVCLYRRILWSWVWVRVTYNIRNGTGTPETFYDLGQSLSFTVCLGGRSSPVGSHTRVRTQTRWGWNRHIHTRYQFSLPLRVFVWLARLI